MFEELKVEEKFNLFAIFPIGTTMQDGGKRKRSDAVMEDLESRSLSYTTVGEFLSDLRENFRK